MVVNYGEHLLGQHACVIPYCFSLPPSLMSFRTAIGIFHLWRYFLLDFTVCLGEVMLFGFCFFNFLHKFCFLLEFFNISIFFFFHFYSVFTRATPVTSASGERKGRCSKLKWDLRNCQAIDVGNSNHLCAHRQKSPKEKNTYKGTIS